MSKQKRIEEVIKDLCEAPTGCVKDDFTVGTLKESHTDLFIRTVAGHLVSLNYRKQSEGEWIWKVKIEPNAQNRKYCSICDTECPSKDNYYLHPKFCHNCGARMKNAGWLYDV